ncbi:MAG: flagellar basal body P-ring formation chaperone FlgA [Pseudomonadota bacterium]
MRSLLIGSLAIILASLQALPVEAGGVVATRMLTRGTVISSSDVRLSDETWAGAIQDRATVIGMELLRTIYAGRPLTSSDIGPAAEVRRNESVELRYVRGPLRIRTDGRALARGARGQRISVMNLASRTIVYGRVAAPGVVEVGE